MPTNRERMEEILTGQMRAPRGQTSGPQAPPRVEAQEGQTARSPAPQTMGQRISDATEVPRRHIGGFLEHLAGTPRRATDMLASGGNALAGLGAAVAGRAEFADSAFDEAARRTGRAVNAPSITGDVAGQSRAETAGGRAPTASDNRSPGRIADDILRVTPNMPQGAPAQPGQGAQERSPLDVAQSASRNMVTGLDEIMQNNPMTMAQMEGLMGNQRENVGTLTGTIPEQREPLSIDDQMMATAFETLMQDTEIGQMLNDPNIDMTPEERAALSNELLLALSALQEGEPLALEGALGQGRR